MHYVYVLQSELTAGFYIGYSLDPEQRLVGHNSGKNISTKAGCPWRLIYFEAYTDKRDALSREKFLKSGSGRIYLHKQLRHFLDTP
ncbi:GIY-YIG nuclease family protein [Candidatus Saccharibacteria bacterium]|nr:GIY-YIG nuclease family protein [Candidatus Saccharibacteria bacterium]